MIILKTSQKISQNYRICGVINVYFYKFLCKTIKMYRFNYIFRYSQQFSIPKSSKNTKLILKISIYLHKTIKMGHILIKNLAFEQKTSKYLWFYIKADLKIALYWDKYLNWKDEQNQKIDYKRKNRLIF